MKKIARLMTKNSDGWRQIGYLYRNADNSVRMKIERLPTGEFDGWVHVCDLVGDP